MGRYKYINEPTDETEKLRLYAVTSYVFDLLTEEEQKALQAEFEQYRDSSHEAGKGFEPWYVWILGRLEVSVKVKQISN